MSIVVIEPCEKNISNRFKIIEVATKRARNLDYRLGASDDALSKSTVRALLEIADGSLSEDGSQTSNEDNSAEDDMFLDDGVK
jgi:DNA-directed RNA polymerase omega subunit